MGDSKAHGDTKVNGNMTMQRRCQPVCFGNAKGNKDDNYFLRFNIMRIANQSHVYCTTNAWTLAFNINAIVHALQNCKKGKPFFNKSVKSKF